MRRNDERQLRERADREDVPKLLAFKHTPEYRALWQRILHRYGRGAIDRARRREETKAELGPLDYDAHSAALDLHSVCEFAPVPLRFPADPDDPDDYGIRFFDAGPGVARLAHDSEVEAGRVAILGYWEAETAAMRAWDGVGKPKGASHPPSILHPGPSHPQALLVVDLAASSAEVVRDLRVLRESAGIRYRVPAGKRDIDSWKEDFRVLARARKPGTKWEIARDTLRRFEDRYVAEASVRNALRRAMTLVDSVRADVRARMKLRRKIGGTRVSSNSRFVFAARGHPNRHP